MTENEASYDKIANVWDQVRKPFVDPMIQRLVKNLEQGSKILDVGCGTGYPVAKYLSEKGFYVTGIDISEKMILKVKGLNLVHATFEKQEILSYQTDQMFEAVIAFDSLFHIPLCYQKDIYPKIASLLLPGGFFLFTHGKVKGSVQGEMLGSLFTYSALDLDEVVNLLEKNGFKIIKLEEDYQSEESGTRDLIVMAQKV